MVIFCTRSRPPSASASIRVISCSKRRGPQEPAEDHRVHACEVRRDLLFVVDHVERHAAEHDGELVRYVRGPFLVVVSADNVERGVSAQLVHDALLIYVPAVEYRVHALEVFCHLGPQQPVRVGDYGEFHALHLFGLFTALDRRNFRRSSCRQARPSQVSCCTARPGRRRRSRRLSAGPPVRRERLSRRRL